MTEPHFYVPQAKSVTLPSGRKLSLRKGIQTLPPELADHPMANDQGIRPVEEMTDQELRMSGLKRADLKRYEPVRPAAPSPPAAVSTVAVPPAPPAKA